MLHETSEMKPAGIFETLKAMVSFASLLRLCGALTVMSAMSAFLMQDWAAGDDISRYYLLLAQTLLLAVGGCSLSSLLKENKGARVFFGLGMLSVTANITVLGALVYSAIHGGQAMVEYPDFAQWKAVDLFDITLALLATMAVSIPLVMFSYRILARESAPVLTSLFIFSNLLLLVPVRESMPLLVLVLVAILIPAKGILGRIRQDYTLRTPEGIFAVMALFIPAALIIIRSFWLYSADTLLVLTLSGIAFTVLRSLVPQTAPHSASRAVMQSLSAATAITITFCAGELMPYALPDIFANSILSGILALLLLDISTRSDRPHRLIFWASIVFAGTHILSNFSYESFTSGLLGVIAGMIVIAVGRKYGLRNVMALGSATIVIIAIPQFGNLMELIDFSNWITLSVLGTAIIVVASLIERHGALLMVKWKRLVSL